MKSLTSSFAFFFTLACRVATGSCKVTSKCDYVRCGPVYTETSVSTALSTSTSTSVPTSASTSSAKAAFELISSDFYCGGPNLKGGHTPEPCYGTNSCISKSEKDLTDVNRQVSSWPAPSTADAKYMVNFWNTTLNSTAQYFLGSCSGCGDWLGEDYVRTSLIDIRNGTQRLGSGYLAKVSDAATKSTGQGVLDGLIKRFDDTINDL